MPRRGPLPVVGDVFQLGNILFEAKGRPTPGWRGKDDAVSAATAIASTATWRAADRAAAERPWRRQRYRKAAVRNNLCCMTCGLAAARNSAASGILPASPPARITSAMRSSVVPVVPDLPVGLSAHMRRVSRRAPGLPEPTVVNQACSELLHRCLGFDTGQVGPLTVIIRKAFTCIYVISRA
jgi:hypothetical protein